MMDGYVDLPEKPGLGVEIDEKGLAAARQEGPWRLRTMRRHPEDNSFSDF